MNSTLRNARPLVCTLRAPLSLLQHPFLLACRLYWGGLFVSTGFSKLTHLALTAERFADWHIPAPYPNAVAAGTTELFCGSLLVLGAASRIVTVPLIGTMIVAYLHGPRRRSHRPVHVCHRTAVLAPVHLPARAAVRAGSFLGRLSRRQIHLGFELRFASEPG